MDADTNLIRDIADLKAADRVHDTRLSAVETGLGILHADMQDAKIDLGKQAVALEAIQGHTKTMAESISSMERIDRGSGNFWKIIGSLLTAAVMIVASVLAMKNGIDPATLRDIVKDAVSSPAPAAPAVSPAAGN